MLTGKNYIGNEQSANGEVYYTTFDPVGNAPNKNTFREATTDEIERAVALAHTAFETYRTFSGIKKAAFLNAIADEIMNLGDALIDVYCKETGLPQGRATGERSRTVGQLRTFATQLIEGSWIEASIDTAQPDRKPIPKPDIRKLQIPLGPVVVFGASNFPLAYSTAGGDTASALAAGCPVIVKSHPMHAGVGELVATAIVKAAQKTGMPNGVFSNLNSSGIDVGVHLVKHPKVKAVGFTGSIKGGRALMDLAAQRPEPIPVFAEMGSINPVVILPQILEDQHNFLVEAYANSITLGCGQFCTNPGLLLGIKSDALTNFVHGLSEKIKEKETEAMLHPNIAKAFAINKEKALSQSGVELTLDQKNEVLPNHANQAIGTISGALFLENKLLQQEVFGPYAIVVQCDDFSELIAIITQLEGQLTGTIMGLENELGKHPKLIEALQNRVGRLLFNGVPTGVEVCPSMVHGGPYPASADSRFTAVGTDAIQRWVRPFAYQNWPNALLPEALQNSNPLAIQRLVNGTPTKEAVSSNS